MQICKNNIEFLGFQLNDMEYPLSKKNIDKIQSLFRPKCKESVRFLLGLANYFRSLIHKYSDILNLLVELTKDKIKFKWSAEAEQAFFTIQEAIVNYPTLRPPDFNKEFFLVTDGSKISISGILAQEENGHLLVLEIFGRKLINLYIENTFV